MEPIQLRLEALLEGSSVELPSDTDVEIHCNTPVNLENHVCVQNERILLYSVSRDDYKRSQTSDTKYLGHIGEFLIACGKKLKQVVMDSCYALKTLSRGDALSHYIVNPRAQEVADCIEKFAKEGEHIRAEIHDLSRERTTTAPPPDFYNSTIAPNITGINNRSSLLATELNAVNGSFENSGSLRDNDSNTMVYCAGGAAGVLIAGMAAIAWKRKTVNNKRRKRYQDMIATDGVRFIKSSENNSLVPQNPIV